MASSETDLFGERVRAGRSRFACPLRVYAERIWPGKPVTSSVRTLKRWVKKGREAEDDPPFDDPAKLAGWYERHHRAASAPPALKRFEEEDADAEADEGVPGDESEEEEERPPMSLDLDGEFSADEGLRQCRALVKATYEQMEQALKQRQTKLYQSLRREWQSLINTQRQWEKDITKIQEGKGEVLRTRVINSELVRIFSATGQSFFNALLKTMQEHSDLPADEQRRIALAKRDEIFTHLRGTRFESAWTAESQ